MTRTTVRLPLELLQAAKKKAAQEGCSLTSLIEDGLRQVLKGGKAEVSKVRPFKLPVSKAQGGLRPGFDLTNMASFYDSEDSDIASLTGGTRE